MASRRRTYAGASARSHDKMSAPGFQSETICDECGRFGAYAFDGQTLCVDCYQQRGACCAEREDQGCGLFEQALATRTHGEVGRTALGVPSLGGDAPPYPSNQDFLKLNPNCCYQACPGCTSVRKLREFQSRFPLDWQTRLRGSQRLIEAALLRD